MACVFGMAAMPFLCRDEWKFSDVPFFFLSKNNEQNRGRLTLLDYIDK